MGFPFEDGFTRREALYLDHETAVMDQFLCGLETRAANDAAPVVIDTTGSVIYTGKAIRQRLRQQTVVVYLSTSPAYRESLHRAYVANPRPVLWQQHFHQKSGEDERAALRRCYKNLLADREARYRQYAHLEIQWDPTPDRSLDVDTLLAPVAAFLTQRRSSHGA
jgi:shikimate kinase